MVPKIKYKCNTLPSVSIKWLKTLTEWLWKTGKVVEIHWSNVENPTLQSDGLNHICKIQNTYYTDIVIHVIQSQVIWAGVCTHAKYMLYKVGFSLLFMQKHFQRVTLSAFSPSPLKPSYKTDSANKSCWHDREHINICPYMFT